MLGTLAFWGLLLSCADWNIGYERHQILHPTMDTRPSLSNGVKVPALVPSTWPCFGTACPSPWRRTAAAAGAEAAHIPARARPTPLAPTPAYRHTPPILRRPHHSSGGFQIIIYFVLIHFTYNKKLVILHYHQIHDVQFLWCQCVVVELPGRVPRQACYS
jgi:hypothetical protein